MAFVRGSNPVWLFDDLSGNLFDDTFYMFVLQNDLPYIPATVYHTPTGTPWTQPIRFFANGTLPIDIFFDPGTAESPNLYRLEFRKGPTQADPLIYLVQNYSPTGSGGSTPLTSVASFTENQVSNPQFAVISFDNPVTITGTVPTTVPASIEVAPGWFLDLTGTGIAVVEQIPLNSTAGLINPTNAPYALHLTLTGWLSATLRQRFQQNGMLWASSASVARYVASSITAKIGAVSQSIYADLIDSNGTLLGRVLNDTALSTNWVEYPDRLLMPITTNTNIPPAAYIDYRLHFDTPGNADVYVTSFQLVSSNVDLNFPYMQESVDRQLDHLFHYYKDPLIQKPMPSYTLGWDFPYNPGQALGLNIGLNGVAVANKSFYVIDQTIVFQTVPNVMSFTVTAPGGFTCHTTTTTSYAIIQYLDQNTAREILAGRISVQIKGYVLNGPQNSLDGNITLWWTDDATLPDLKPANYNSLVSVVDSAGNVTAGNGTWHKVPRPNNTDATFTLPLGTGTVFNNQGAVFSFNGWDPTLTSTPSTTAKYFAIVIGFANMTALTDAVIRYCTMASGDIASPPSPMNEAQTLQGLQYYYQKSFLYGVVPANAVGVHTGESYGTQILGASVGSTPGPIIRYNTEMRKAPTIATYNPSAGTANNIYDETTTQTWSNIFVSVTTPQSFYTLGTTPAGPAAAGNICSLHWTADARLGIVL